MGASLVDLRRPVTMPSSFYDGETEESQVWNLTAGTSHALHQPEPRQDVRLSSELSPLIPKHPSLSEVDEFAIAGFLLVGYRAAIDHERTPYKSISQVAAGSFNTIAGRELTQDHMVLSRIVKPRYACPRLHDLRAFPGSSLPTQYRIAFEIGA